MATKKAAMSELRVWYLASSTWDCRDYFDLVTEGERRRAERFRSQEDAGRFLASRALVRVAVGGFLNLPYCDLMFDRRCTDCGASTHGRPTVRLPDGTRPSVHFSATRAGRVVGVAVGSVPLGIDAESPRAGIEDLIDSPVFSPADRVWIRDAPATSVAQRVLERWVAKEAVGKAAGLGLARADEVVVPPASHRWQRATDAEGRSCRLTALDLPGAAASAIATYAPSADLVVADARASLNLVIDERLTRPGRAHS